MAADERAHDQSHEVTPLELFFDLVFVFGISQLSHHLYAHLSWRGATEALVMLVGIFAVWMATSWTVTIIGGDQPRTRWITLAVMVLGLFMNASVTGAFENAAWSFVVPLLIVLLGRALWTVAYAGDPVLRSHYVHVLLWLLVSTPLWITGAAVGSEARLWWWGFGAAVDALGRWLAHPIPGRKLQWERVRFDLEHLLHRCRLFLIIALGETVFTTGTAIAAAPLGTTTVVVGTVALTLTIALWALNFGHSARLTLHYQHDPRPLLTGRHAVNALMVMVAGLIALAVANEMVIDDPRRAGSVSLNLLLCGGPALYLLAQGWFLRMVSQDSPLLRLTGIGVLAVVGLATSRAPAYLALALAGVTLTVLALLDQRVTRKLTSG